MTLKSFCEKHSIKLGRLPKGITFSVNEKELTLLLSEQSLTSNMQCQRSAFESWAIILKNRLGEWIDKVKITWDCDIKEGDKGYLDYNRFIYRLEKFIESYDWVYTDKSISLCLTGIVCNLPSKEANIPKGTDESENQIEHDYIDKHKSEVDGHLYHQLPMGLFRDKVSNGTYFTNGKKSAVDIWGIKGSELYIFELKKPGNQSIGIISELMYYVNVINDILQHKINYCDASKINKALPIRGFEEFYALYKEGRVTKINAIFLADGLHTLITEDVIKIINNSARYQYLNIVFSHQSI